MSSNDGVPEDDLRPEYDLDYSNAKPNRFATMDHVRRESSPPRRLDDETTTQKIVKLIFIAVACAILCCVMLAVFAWRQSWRETDKEAEKIGQWMPELVSAPSVADQAKTIAAMKAHPNPPFSSDLLPPLGSDASALSVLLATMKSSTKDGVTSYYFTLARAPNESSDWITYVHIDVGGNPARVIRCQFKHEPNP